MEIKKKISFGSHEWVVLDIKDGKALIITESIIEHRSYHNSYIDITWENCSLRKYLNEDFYCLFSKDEQSKICLTKNDNPNNQWYGVDGGNKTNDYVFLLSMEEAVCKYFGDSSDKLYNPGKNQRYWFERKDINNSKRIARLEKNKEQVWWWWTRTPGRVGVKAVYIHGDGNIGIQGNNVLKGNVADGCCMGGVRPAMWIKI